MVFFSLPFYGGRTAIDCGLSFVEGNNLKGENKQIKIQTLMTFFFLGIKNHQLNGAVESGLKVRRSNSVSSVILCLDRKGKVAKVVGAKALSEERINV